MKGPVRIPTKKLVITTRRSPCGNGTNTWDRYEMRIHKRVIDIYCPSSAIKEITEFRLDPGVDVNLIVWKQWERSGAPRRRQASHGVSLRSKRRTTLVSNQVKVVKY